MTAEFERAFRRVLHDVRLDAGAGADLIAVGVKRADCVEMLQEMYEEGDHLKPEWLSMLVQWAVATGVWLERERWQSIETREG